MTTILVDDDFCQIERLSLPPTQALIGELGGMKDELS